MCQQQRGRRLWPCLLAVCVAWCGCTAPPAARAQCSANQTANSLGAQCAAQLVAELASSAAAVAALDTQQRVGNLTAVVNQALACSSLATRLRSINVLAPQESLAFLANPRAMQAFTAQTGYTMNFQAVPGYLFTDRLVRALKETPTLYDGYVYDGIGVVDIAEASGFAPLDSYVSSDATLDWADIIPHFSKVGSVYDGRIVGVPFSGWVPVLYYRRDVFLAHNLSVPSTWDDLAALAAAMNGTDFDGDGAGDWSMCMDLGPGCQGSFLVQQILASMVQYQGYKQGLLFDPPTMEPLVDNAAMAEAWRLYRALARYNLTPRTAADIAAGAVCSPLDTAFRLGRCLLTVRWADVIKSAQRSAIVRGNVGVAPIPGSPVVYSRKLRQLLSCNATLCPYGEKATVTTTTANASATGGGVPAAAAATPSPAVASGGTTVFINRAPYSGLAPVSGGVNLNAPPDYQNAMYTYMSWWAGKARTMQTVVSLDTFVGPFRESHLNRSLWANATIYDQSDIGRFLAVYSATLLHPNLVLDPRIISAAAYRIILDDAAQVAANTTSLSVSALMSSVMGQFMTQLNASAAMVEGGVQAIQQSYWRALGYTPDIIPIDTGSGLSSGELAAAVIVPVVVGCLLAGLLVLFIVRHASLAHRTWLGKVTAPEAGPNTTLLISDVEGSTSLWETLPPEVMDSALQLHNATIRALLDKHGGYECGTEGDSFITAFHDAMSAVLFAVEAQEALLQCGWPEELLATTQGRPCWYRLKNSTMPYVDSCQRKTAAPSFILSRADLSRLNQVAASFLGRSPASGIPASRAASLMVMYSPASANPISQILRSAVGGGAAGGAAPDRAVSSVVPHAAPSCATLTAEGASCVEQQEAQPEQPLTLLQQLLQSIEVLAKDEPGAVPLMAGLRVRMGIHAGVPRPEDRIYNAASTRYKFTGPAFDTTLAVSDAGQGGHVMLSESCVLAMGAETLRDRLGLAHLGDHCLKDDGKPPVSLYLVLPHSLMAARLAHLAPPRTAAQVSASVLQAPVGTVAAAFLHVVGLPFLMQWNEEVARASVQLLTELVYSLLWSEGGYLVDFSTEGKYVVAFSDPRHACMWAVRVIDEAKNLHWPAELLEYELTEEIVSSTVMDGKEVLATVFRGMRLKIGIDVGRVAADIQPTTGRMNYVGRPMNRAARIAAATVTGQVWCSEDVALASHQLGPLDESTCEQLSVRSLGAFDLKGVREQMRLLQCTRTLALSPLSMMQVPSSPSMQCTSPLTAHVPFSIPSIGRGRQASLNAPWLRLGSFAEVPELADGSTYGAPNGATTSGTPAIIEEDAAAAAAAAADGDAGDSAAAHTDGGKLRQQAGHVSRQADAAASGRVGSSDGNGYAAPPLRQMKSSGTYASPPGASPWSASVRETRSKAVGWDLPPSPRSNAVTPAMPRMQPPANPLSCRMPAGAAAVVAGSLARQQASNAASAIPRVSGAIGMSLAQVVMSPIGASSGSKAFTFAAPSCGPPSAAAAIVASLEEIPPASLMGTQQGFNPLYNDRSSSNGQLPPAVSASVSFSASEYGVVQQTVAALQDGHNGMAPEHRGQQAECKQGHSGPHGMLAEPEAASRQPASLPSMDHDGAVAASRPGSKVVTSQAGCESPLLHEHVAAAAWPAAGVTLPSDEWAAPSRSGSAGSPRLAPRAPKMEVHASKLKIAVPAEDEIPLC